MVKIVKLIDGKDVICKEVAMSENGDKIEAIMPFEIAVNPATGNAALRVYTLGAENLTPETPIIFNPLAVVCITTATDDIVSTYNELYNKIVSNLVTPTPEEKKLILG